MSQGFASLDSALAGIWLDFTPTLTAVTTDPTLGDSGVTYGRYVQNGKLVTTFIHFSLAGTGQNAGSGDYIVSLPVAARTAYPDYSRIGNGTARVDGIEYLISAILWSTDRGEVRMGLDGNANEVAHNVPGSWGVGSDQLFLTLVYEAE